MTKAPSKIKITFNKDFYACLVDDKISADCLNERYPDNAPYTEHFYVLEENMDQKKEMTAKDAWIALANGECVDDAEGVHRIDGGRLLWWVNGSWNLTPVINKGPYSIVPDPSKPVVSEYEKDKRKFIERADSNNRADIIEFMERNYVRKNSEKNGDSRE